MDSEYEDYMDDWRQRVAEGVLVENVDSLPDVRFHDGMDALFDEDAVLLW